MACDAVAEYTVVNHTDRALITRIRFESDCNVVDGNRADYLPEERIKPFETHESYDIYGTGIGGPSAECVQVLTADRRLILGAPYDEGKTYEVEEPVEPAGKPAPKTGELPDQSGPDQILEGIKEHPVQNAIGITVILFLLAMFAFFFGGGLVGLIIAVFLVTRFFYRHYVGKT